MLSETEKKPIFLNDLNSLVQKQGPEVLKYHKIRGGDPHLGIVDIIIQNYEPHESHRLSIKFYFDCLDSNRKTRYLRTPTWEYVFAISGLVSYFFVFINAVSSYHRHHTNREIDHTDDTRMKEAVYERVKEGSIDQAEADKLIKAHRKGSKRILSYDTPILIVDDKKSLLQDSMGYFNNLGFYNILKAEDGLEALAILQEDPSLGLVLSDIDMPKKKGLSLLESVRNREAGPSHSDIIFMLYSFGDLAKQVENARKLGADAYIIKPLTEKVLEEKLRPYMIVNQ